MLADLVTQTRHDCFDDASLVAYSDKLMNHICQHQKKIFKNEVKLFHSGFPTAYNTDKPLGDQDMNVMLNDF